MREKAAQAKAAGATRFCMGAAWRSPRDKDLDAVIAMIDAVRAEGLETCVTAGMLRRDQAQRLKDAGLIVSAFVDPDSKSYCARSSRIGAM